jgi:predicted Zn-dependent protease
MGVWERGYALLREVTPDADVQTALGLIELRKERPKTALALMEAAARAEPANSLRRLNLAAALMASGQRERAKTEALRALQLEPLLQDVYVLLAEIEPRRSIYWKAEFERQRIDKK